MAVKKACPNPNKMPVLSNLGHMPPKVFQLQAILFLSQSKRLGIENLAMDMQYIVAMHGSHKSHPTSSRKLKTVGAPAAYKIRFTIARSIWWHALWMAICFERHQYARKTAWQWMNIILNNQEVDVDREQAAATCEICNRTLQSGNHQLRAWTTCSVAILYEVQRNLLALPVSPSRPGTDDGCNSGWRPEYVCSKS